MRRSACAAPPAVHPAVVAAAQHVGDRVAAELRGTRVLRVLEQPVGEGLVGTRHLVAHHAGHEACDRVDHHEGGRLTAGEHVVADRQLAVAQVIGNPLVDALVAPAEE